MKPYICYRADENDLNLYLELGDACNAWITNWLVDAIEWNESISKAQDR